MKKVFLSVALVLGVGLTQINAQEAQRVSYGVKGEANLSNFILEDMLGLESTMNVGASLGGFVKIDFGKYFALQPEMLFHFQNSKLKQSNVENDFQYWGMEVPLYAVGQLTQSNGDRAYIGIGPYGRLGFSAKNKTADFDFFKENSNNEAFMVRGEVGAGVLVGYEFAFGMQINASYKYGLTNLLDANSDNSFMRSQTVSLGIGYRF